MFWPSPLCEASIYIDRLLFGFKQQFTPCSLEHTLARPKETASVTRPRPFFLIQMRDELTCVPLLWRCLFLFATVEMAEWPRSGPYLRALAEWGFDSRLATRFAILGRNLFASPGARGSFLYSCGVVTIFLSLFSPNWESDVSSETLWRSCGVGRGAGGFGGLAWHPPIALTGWGLVQCEIPTPSSHDLMYPLANGAKYLGIFCIATRVRLELGHRGWCLRP
jgi:hypothetical protein